MQTDLKLGSKKPSASNEEISSLILALENRGWRNATQLTAATGMPARKIRACAEHAKGRILSHPSRGYHLTAQATPEDYRLARRQLASRIRHLADRLRASDIAWHAIA